MYGENYMEFKWQLPIVVGYILMAATDTRKLPGMLAPKLDDTVSNLMLGMSAKLVSLITTQKNISDFELAMLRDKWGIPVDLKGLELGELMSAGSVRLYAQQMAASL
jgi:hypothetical protein